MKIIDSHIHFANREGFYRAAQAAGHENTVEHLLDVFKKENIVGAIAMGSGSGRDDKGECLPMTLDLAGTLSLEPYNQPGNIAYCCGLTSSALTPENTRRAVERFEEHLRHPNCVGLKLYPGYNHIYLSDPVHYPFYELAQQYQVPVVIHTGDTATSTALVKYSHPLTVDEVAVAFPKVNFVMAHYGNPWIVDATEVAKKNPNVFLDLSGLAEGNFTADWFWETYSGYLQHLQTWLTYLGDYNKVLYGSDWPLVNIPTYLEIIRRLIPSQHHERVFYQNAKELFSRLEALGI